MAAITVYGIPNCDQVRKARAWLDAHGVAFAFHDFRKDGLDRATLERWLARAGRDVLVNRKGTTWRGLDDAAKAAAGDDAGALALMLAKPTVIKRPVIETGAGLLVGYDAQEYESRFAR